MTGGLAESTEVGSPCCVASRRPSPTRSPPTRWASPGNRRLWSFPPDERVEVLADAHGPVLGMAAGPWPKTTVSVSGRGLGLVDAIATAWAAEHGADGTTVWFEIER